MKQLITDLYKTHNKCSFSSLGAMCTEKRIQLSTGCFKQSTDQVQGITVWRLMENTDKEADELYVPTNLIRVNSRTLLIGKIFDKKKE